MIVVVPADLIEIVPLVAIVATLVLDEEYVTAPSESVVKPAEKSASRYVLLTEVEEILDVGSETHLHLFFIYVTISPKHKPTDVSV